MGRIATSFIVVLVSFVLIFGGIIGWTSFQALSTTIDELIDENKAVAEVANTLMEEYTTLNNTYLALQDDYRTLNNTYVDSQNSYHVLEAHYSLLEDERDILLENLTRALQDLEQLSHLYNFTSFYNMSQLIAWLSRDTTDQNSYIPTLYDCDDFALSLMINAFKSGYTMTMVAIYYSDTLLHLNGTEGIYWFVPKILSLGEAPDLGYHLFGNHIANLAYVNDTGWVLIEPQTDDVYPLGSHEL